MISIYIFVHWLSRYLECLLCVTSCFVSWGTPVNKAENIPVLTSLTIQWREIDNMLPSRSICKREENIKSLLTLCDQFEGDGCLRLGCQRRRLRPGDVEAEMWKASQAKSRERAHRAEEPFGSREESQAEHSGKRRKVGKYHHLGLWKQVSRIWVLLWVEWKATGTFWGWVRAGLEWC